MNQAELYKECSLGQHQYGLYLIDLIVPKNGDRVLDIGSGTGNLTYDLASRVGDNGEVLAIDPDSERMAVAKSNQPVKIKNIDWYNGSILSYPDNLNNKFNIAFSNYVFHWIFEQAESIKKVYDALLPGGKFAFAVVCGHPQLIEELLVATGDAGEILRKRFYYISKDSWLALLKSTGFTHVQQVPVNDYTFSDLDEMLVWWQATTQGSFSVDQLSVKQLKELKGKYPGSVSIYGNEILTLIAEK